MFRRFREYIRNRYTFDGFECVADAGQKKGISSPCSGFVIPFNPFTRRWYCWYCGGRASAPSFRRRLKLRVRSARRFVLNFLGIDPDPVLTWVFSVRNGTRKAVCRKGRWERKGS